MGERTLIQWCDATVNFWSGCSKVSAGCAHCYAEGLSKRDLPNVGKWGKGAPRKWHESAVKLAQRLNKTAAESICECCDKVSAGAVWSAYPMKCPDCAGPVNGRKRRVFSLSLGDWLDEEVPVEWLARMLETVRTCENIDWILVTKRPENFEARLAAVYKYWDEHSKIKNEAALGIKEWQLGVIPQNVWVLVSVENQAMGDLRIPLLLKIPAAVHGISCEPLLERVRLDHITDANRFPGAATFDVLKGRMIHHDDDDRWTEDYKLDWVIVGGESGNEARPCHLDWIGQMVLDCKLAKVPVFVKQLGANVVEDVSDHVPAANENSLPEDIAAWEHHRHNAPLHLKHKKGGDLAEWPEVLRIQQHPA